MTKLKPVTPGELLRDEFLVPMGMSRYRIARELKKIKPWTGAGAPLGRTA